LKHFNLSSLIAISSFACTIALTGCTVGTSGAFPDVPSQSQLGTIQGSDYGGHAPLVGAHIYVLQPAVTGYGAQATSLLSASYSGTSYPTTANTSDTGIPTTGTPWYYQTTDSTGAFNISSDYTCTANYPVYIYAYGGTPTTLASNASYAVSSFNVVSAATAGSTLKFTVAAQGFTAGQQIILSGFTGSYAYLNGQSAVVLTAGLASTTFELSGLTGAGSLTTGNTYTTAGTATVDASFNNGVVNLLMLGVCPSSGNFSTGGTLFDGSTFTPLKYVYVNEVSTVAMAYAMAGFGTDGLHIGTDTSTAATLTAPGIRGIQNAAMNAGNLYDIQGKYVSTVAYGEGHIANPTTFNGSQNGTVPQAELDTLGNILAACVDSGNYAGNASTACNTLLSSASSNGGNTGGTSASNTAQAAFNIAHYPMTSSVVSLYTLPTGSVPFTPHLTAQPNDFTVGIVYASTANATSGASATSTLAAPVGVAIDSYGDAYIPSGTVITKLSPLGISLASTSTSLTGLDSIAIDQAGNVWGTTIGSVGGQNGSGGLYEFTSGLASVSGSPFNSALYAPTAIVIDSSNNLFITQYNQLSGGSNVLGYVSHSSYTTLTQLGSNACFNQATSVVVGASDYAWVASSQNNNLCRVNSSTTFGFNGTGGSSQNFNFSLDSGNNGWFGNHGQSNVYKTTSSGTVTAMGKSTVQNQTNNNIAGLYQPTWSAIDGSGNVFLQNDNSTNSSISEISNAGVALSCPTCLTQNATPYYGYQPGNVGQLGSKLSGAEYPGGIAVDPSGNLWVANYSLNSVLEIIGVGTPLVTPLSSEKGGIAP
jgi:hypothetical protein